MRTVQLYGTGSATANAVAQVTIPTAGKLRGMFFSLAAAVVANGGAATVELSKIPTSQIGANGSLDPFFSLKVVNNLVTSGMTAYSPHGFVPLDVEVRQGEVVYLHAAVNSATYYFNAILVYG